MILWRRLEENGGAFLHTPQHVIEKKKSKLLY